MTNRRASDIAKLLSTPTDVGHPQVESHSIAPRNIIETASSSSSVVRRDTHIVNDSSLTASQGWFADTAADIMNFNKRDHGSDTSSSGEVSDPDTSASSDKAKRSRKRRKELFEQIKVLQDQAQAEACEEFTSTLETIVNSVKKSVFYYKEQTKLADSLSSIGQEILKCMRLETAIKNKQSEQDLQQTTIQFDIEDSQRRLLHNPSDTTLQGKLRAKEEELRQLTEQNASSVSETGKIQKCINDLNTRKTTQSEAYTQAQKSMTAYTKMLRKAVRNLDHTNPTFDKVSDEVITSITFAKASIASEVGLADLKFLLPILEDTQKQLQQSAKGSSQEMPEDVVDAAAILTFMGNSHNRNHIPVETSPSNAESRLIELPTPAGIPSNNFDASPHAPLETRVQNQDERLLPEDLARVDKLRHIDRNIFITAMDQLDMLPNKDEIPNLGNIDVYKDKLKMAFSDLLENQNPQKQKGEEKLKCATVIASLRYYKNYSQDSIIQQAISWIETQLSATADELLHRYLPRLSDQIGIPPQPIVNVRPERSFVTSVQKNRTSERVSASSVDGGSQRGLQEFNIIGSREYHNILQAYPGIDDNTKLVTLRENLDGMKRRVGNKQGSITRQTRTLDQDVLTNQPFFDFGGQVESLNTNFSEVHSALTHSDGIIAIGKSIEQLESAIGKVKEAQKHIEQIFGPQRKMWLCDELIEDLEAILSPIKQR